MSRPEMTIDEACRSILGERLAGAIINDQGIHWAVVAAMAQAQVTDDRRALAAIRKWNERQRSA